MSVVQYCAAVYVTLVYNYYHITSKPSSFPTDTGHSVEGLDCPTI